ncbi:MAG TPA: L,D-transpeptidase, partial [Pararhizobium sp.]|nr:L,D-transpeptidase [Pararhizobium sp.]
MPFRPRLTVFGLMALIALTGCTTIGVAPPPEPPSAADYAAVKDGDYELPAVPIKKVDKRYWRQTVAYKTSEKPGTIVVDTPNRFLYYVEPGGQAVRYGISVGKSGFAWEGDAYIAWKQKWPKWTPPKEMVERSPHLSKYAEDGMKPGLKNPLGARALYLFSPNGRDTLYRLHGTPEWRSIGKAASSGCIRLMNQDIIDLYNRVAVGRQAKVVV